MSKITINFKNLCALFTRKLNDELMVGLLDLSDFYGVPERDFHLPKITIETRKKVVDPNGETVFVDQRWIYEGFARKKTISEHVESHGAHHESCEHIFGTIQLDVPGVSPGLNLELSRDRITELEDRENRKRLHNRLPHISVGSFDETVDIEKELYTDRELKVNPGLCKAKLHFRHGTLYSILPCPPNPIAFRPNGSGARNSNYPIETGLEIDIPEYGYAVLRSLNSDAKDFIFEGGAEHDYNVIIENSPPGHEDGEHEAGSTNHFKYYYKLVETDVPLEPMFLPEPGSPSGDPACMNSGFGVTDY